MSSLSSSLQSPAAPVSSLSSSLQSPAAPVSSLSSSLQSPAPACSSSLDSKEATRVFFSATTSGSALSPSESGLIERVRFRGAASFSATGLKKTTAGRLWLWFVASAAHSRWSRVQSVCGPRMAMAGSFDLTKLDTSNGGLKTTVMQPVASSGSTTRAQMRMFTAKDGDGMETKSPAFQPSVGAGHNCSVWALNGLSHHW